MKKWGLVLMMIVLLSGCSVKSEAALETVTDGLETEPPAPYCIVFSVPEGMTQETFGEDGRCAVYEAENGDYTITTEILDATTVEGAAEQISGIASAMKDGGQEVILITRLSPEKAWMSQTFASSAQNSSHPLSLHRTIRALWLCVRNA